MIAGGSPPYPRRRHQGAAPSSFRPSPIRCQGLVGEDCDDTRQQAAFGEISTKKDGRSCWSDALVGEGGTPRLPRDSSTCILWCAIALGALVRGHPMAQVGALLPSHLSFRLSPPFYRFWWHDKLLLIIYVLHRPHIIASAALVLLSIRSRAAAPKKWSESAVLLAFRDPFQSCIGTCFPSHLRRFTCDWFLHHFDPKLELSRRVDTLISPKIHCGLVVMMPHLTRPGERWGGGLYLRAGAALWTDSSNPPTSIERSATIWAILPYSPLPLC